MEYSKTQLKENALCKRAIMGIAIQFRKQFQIFKNECFPQKRLVNSKRLVKA